MSPLRLEPPDVVDGEGFSRFKRMVAITAAVIVLLGAAIGLLHDHSVNREDRLTALAQGEAARQLGLAASGNAVVERAYRLQTEHDLLQIRSFAARRHDDAARPGLLAETANRLRNLTPLLAEPSYAADPYVPARFFADTFADERRSSFVQAAHAETADAWGRKASTYVSLFPLFAGALFLMGLSLVARVARGVFVVVGVGLAVVGSAHAAVVAFRDVPHTSNAAIKAMAEGDRQATVGDYDAAVAAFSEAIQVRPDYGMAYLRRASARWQAAAEAHPFEPYIEYIAGPALTAALADTRRAVAYGQSDLTALNQLAALLIHEQRYAEAGQYLHQALDEDDRLAVVWTNLGAVKVAQGDDAAAEMAYARAIDLSENEPSVAQRRSLFSAARAVLDEIAVRVPTGRPLAERMASLITAGELRFAFKNEATVDQVGNVSNLGLERAGTSLTATFDDSFPANTLAAIVGYYRSSSDRLWRQPGELVQPIPLTGGHNRFTVPVGNCPRPGEYRFDVEAGGRRAASERITVAPVAGAPLIYEEAPLIGAALCRPPDWTEMQIPDAVGFSEPAGPGRVVIGVASDATGAEALLARLADLSLPLRDSRTTTISHLTGRLLLYESQDRFQFVFVAPDGSLLRHFVIEGAVGAKERAEEMLATATFLDRALP